MESPAAVACRSPRLRLGKVPAILWQWRGRPRRGSSATCAQRGRSVGPWAVWHQRKMAAWPGARWTAPAMRHRKHISLQGPAQPRCTVLCCAMLCCARLAGQYPEVEGALERPSSSSSVSSLTLSPPPPSAASAVPGGSRRPLPGLPGLRHLAGVPDVRHGGCAG